MRTRNPYEWLVHVNALENRIRHTHVAPFAARPPELLLGAELYSAAVDMWGAACIFCKLLTGKLPFTGGQGLPRRRVVAYLS